MYTQCPECKTVFRIHAAQLKAAQGAVRCGQCSQTFDALENLFQTQALANSIPQTETALEDHDALESGPEEFENPLPEDVPLPEETEQFSTTEEEILSSEITSEQVDLEEGPEQEQTPETVEGSDLNEPSREEDAPLPEELSSAWVEAPPSEDSSEQVGLEEEIEQEEAPDSIEGGDQDDPSQEAARQEWDDFDEEHIGALLTSSENDENNLDEDLNLSTSGEYGKDEARLDEEDFLSVELGELNGDFDLETVIEQVSEESEDIEMPLPEPSIEEEGPANNKHNRQDEAADAIAELPPQLIDLDEKRGGGIATTLFWFLASLLMVGAIVLQYAYFNRMQLAENGQYRPWLEELCAVARCNLPLRQALNSIELIDHAVQSHPRYANSLVITATIVNSAPFPQPYPVVEILMTDIAQNRIASRRFDPVEYLAGTSPDGAFDSEIAVHLMLEVLDPGKDAVGFEFKFH